MTPPETETVIVGSFLFLGAVLAVAREAVKRNWVACSFSFRVTTPDARYLRGPKVKQEPVPQAAPEPSKDARVVSLGEAS